MSQSLSVRVFLDYRSDIGRKFKADPGYATLDIGQYPTEVTIFLTDRVALERLMHECEVLHAEMAGEPVPA